MKTRYIVLLLVAASVLFSNLRIANADDGFISREWRSQDGEYSIQAVFVKYDNETKLVDLRREDNEIIQVPVLGLCQRDRRYILRMIKPKRPKSKDLKQKTASKPPKTNDDQPRRSTELVDSSRKKTRRPNAKPIAGILWHPSINDALLSAGGDTTKPDDDRPIMWFRVLGDLDGFM